MVILDVNES